MVQVIVVSQPTLLREPLRSELFDAIRLEGYEPADDPDQLEIREALQAPELLLRVAEGIGVAAAVGLAKTAGRVVVKWWRTRRLKDLSGVVRVIYGPDDSELARVHIESEDPDD